jgi:cobalt-zinc-cadmium efflux system membrane fusion protein
MEMPESVKPWIKKLLIGSVLILLSSVLYHYLFRKELDKKDKASEKSDRFQVPPEILNKYSLSFTQLKEKGLNEEITLPGIVSYDLEKLARVGSRVGGKITKVFVKEGDYVEKGKILAIMTSVELGNVESAYVKSKVRLEALRLQFERAVDLKERKVISAKDYDFAFMEYKTAQTETETTRNALRNYGLSDEDIYGLENGKYNSVNFALRSPISGTITDRQAVLGQSVTSDLILFTVADLSTLWILLEVYEKDLYSLSIGQEAKVIPLGGTKENEVIAKVAHVSEIIDPLKHTAEIRLEVRNPKGKLKPGQTVTSIVQGLIQESQNKTMVNTLPQSSVHQIEGEYYVFVQNPEKSFSARKVEIGRSIDDEIEILKGIMPSDNVVVDGSFILKSEYLKL